MCRHVAHAECHRDWFCPDSFSDGDSNADERSRGEQECPAGCGCHCMDYAEEGFGFVVPQPISPPLNLPPPMVPNKQSFGLGSKKIFPVDDQGRSGPGSSGGNYLHVDDDYFEDEMLGEDDDYEDDEKLLEDEDEEGGGMFELQNPIVQISEY